MKNKELKELLNKAKDIVKYGADGKQHTRMFNQFEAKALLSYIEQLENLCNKYEQEHKTTFEIWKEDIKKLKQLENNKDKVIEICDFYNKKYEKDPLENQKVLFVINNIKNILKGDSE